MPEIVLVHGIGQEHKSATELEEGLDEGAWLPALARGVKTAGFKKLSERIWRDGQGRGGPRGTHGLLRRPVLGPRAARR